MLEDVHVKISFMKIQMIFVRVVIHPVEPVQMILLVIPVYLHKIKLLLLLGCANVLILQYTTHPYKHAKPVVISVLLVIQQNRTAHHVLHLPSERTIIINANVTFTIMMMGPVLPV